MEKDLKYYIELYDLAKERGILKNVDFDNKEYYLVADVYNGKKHETAELVDENEFKMLLEVMEPILKIKTMEDFFKILNIPKEELEKIFKESLKNWKV